MSIARVPSSCRNASDTPTATAAQATAVPYLSRAERAAWDRTTCTHTSSWNPLGERRQTGSQGNNASYHVGAFGETLRGLCFPVTLSSTDTSWRLSDSASLRHGHVGKQPN